MPNFRMQIELEIISRAIKPSFLFFCLAHKVYLLIVRVVSMQGEMGFSTLLVCAAPSEDLNFPPKAVVTEFDVGRFPTSIASTLLFTIEVWDLHQKSPTNICHNSFHWVSHKSCKKPFPSEGNKNHCISRNSN